MNQLGHFINKRFPSSAWCSFLLALFSFYSYKNIFLQAEMGFKLPTVNLVSALNNFDIFVAAPSTEKFDLYVNLAKTFDAYKKDYMQHYDDYLILLNTYLVLDESQIALKYYAYKHYIKEEYRDKDNFVLGSPIIEFNENFYTPKPNSTDREINLINKHYHVFGIRDNRQKYEDFFNNYIYPLYKSQSSWKEVEIATSIAKVLNQWTLVNNLQIAVFMCSLCLNAISYLTFMLTGFGSKKVVKQNAVAITAIFLILYTTIGILIFICLCVKFFTYRTNQNFEGLHNTGFILLQFSWLMMIGYFTTGWIVEFRRSGNQENENEYREDSLQAQLTELMKISLDDDSFEKSNKYNHLLSTGCVGKAVNPFVEKLKRIVTPRGSNSTTLKQQQDQKMQRAQLEHNRDLEMREYEKVETPIDSIDTQKLYSNDPFDGLKALNLVSAMSINHPDVSPYSQLSPHSEESSKELEQFSATESTSKAASSVSQSLPIFGRSGVGSVTKSLDDRRKGFYQHTGDSAQLKVDKSPGSFLVQSEKSTPSSEYYGKSFLNRSSSHREPLQYSFEDKRRNLNDVEWESKFGLRSSNSGVSTVGENLEEGDSKNITKKQAQLPQQQFKKSKNNISNTIENTMENRPRRKTNPPEVKKTFQYLIPSTTVPSASSDGGTDLNKTGNHITGASVTGEFGEESLFSIDRIVQNHRRSV